MGSVPLMATGRVGNMMSVIAVACLVLMDGVAGGRSTPANPKTNSTPIKHTVKTIMTDYGDVIDCVDIYKQPAFDHPLLRNHTIQMRSSSHSTKKVSSPKSIGQLWHRSGRCPEGAVPIRRNSRNDLIRPTAPGESTMDNAQIQVQGINYGGEATVNVWNLFVNDGDSSSGSMQVGRLNMADFINAGWMVSPANIYGNNQTRLFTNWASKAGGCYDVMCPGFVQVSQDFAIGAVIAPVSTYGDIQYVFDLAIFQDRLKGNWWLMYQGVELGYWPKSLFNDLGTNADYINWGGQVYNAAPDGQHTRTQMGSGYPPDPNGFNFQHVAFFSDCVYYNAVKQPVTPSQAQISYLVTSPGCYNMTNYAFDQDGTPGLTFYYGGTGYPGCEQS